MKLQFADGSRISIKNIFKQTEYIQNVMRDIFMIEIDPKEATMSELRNIFSDSTKTSNLFTVNSSPETVMEGENEKEMISEIGVDYTMYISCSNAMREIPNVTGNISAPTFEEINIVKIAQLSYNEKLLFDFLNPKPVDPDSLNFEDLKTYRLSENSKMCNTIIETKFISSAKENDRQPYRMNRDDQSNLFNINTKINNLRLNNVSEEDMPLFTWQNSNQLKGDDDWTHIQIVNLLMEFEDWKTSILNRQNEIKEAMSNTTGKEELNEIAIDYSDLLVFE